MKVKGFGVIILTLVFMASFNLRAYSDQQEDANLGQVVVQATKSGEKLQNVPATVSVITDKDIQQTSDTRNIGDILWQVPGVLGQDKHHTDANVISFRGVNFHDWVTYGILVLVDGIPINDADGRVDFQSVDLSDVKRIEVIKGPVSALYGPNGSVGVINIVTKNPPKKFTGKASFSYGSYKTWKANVSGGQTVGTVGVRLNVTRKGSQGYLPRSSYFEDKADGKITKDLGDLGNVNMDLFYGHTSRETPGALDETQFENQERIATSDAATEMTFYRAALSYKKGFSRSSIHWNLYYNKKYRDSYWSSTSGSHGYIHLAGSEARYLQMYKLFDLPNRLTLGASAKTQRGLNDSHSSYSGDTSYYSIQNNYGVYAQNVVSLVKPLKLTLGLRYDKIHYKNNDKLGDNSGTKSLDAWSPKFGITYNYKAQTVYMTVGRGFMPPTMRQMFWASIPNPDLKPEYLTDYEIGVRGRIIKGLSYESDVYYMKVKDEINRETYYEYDPATHKTTRLTKYVNMGKTIHKGFEATLKYRLVKHVILRANYSFNISRYNNDPTYGDNYIHGDPKHMLGLGVTYFDNGLTMSVWMKKIWKYYMDDENTKYYPGYTLLNAKVSYKWKRFFASLYVNNLLDNYYATRSLRYWRTNYRTGELEPSDYYFPGWPINIMFTVGMKF